MTSLYFVSSPLHIFVAYTYLLSDLGEEPAILCVINSNKNLKDLVSRYQNAANKTFTNIIHLKRLSSPIKERLQKNSCLSAIEQLIKKLRPIKIYTGNDRRIEFQYASHIAKHNNDCKSIYLDEGIYTYIKRSTNHKKANNPIRDFIKRRLYGQWWEDSNQVGESTHIDEKMVFFPDELNSNKTIHSFPIKTFQGKQFKLLCSEILKQFKVNTEELKTADTIYTLPHEQLLLNNRQYQNTLSKHLLSISQKERLFTKNHPRNTKGVNELLGINCPEREIPPKIPFELILPFLNHCTIMADVSSTLLLSRIIRPDLTTLGLSSTLARDYDSTLQLFISSGVTMTDISKVQINND